MQPGVDEIQVTLSLWEKLSEGDTRSGVGTRVLVTATLQDLRDSVVRHLEVLLNARQCEEDLDSRFPASSSSVLAYGVTDFTTLVLSSPSDRETVRRSVERSIRLFEPRLARVKVSLNDWEETQRALNLHISAELRVEPENEPVAFDAFLAKDLRRFSVTGGRS